MNHKIKGFLHCEPARSWMLDCVNGYSLQFYNSKEIPGMTMVMPVSFDIELPDDWNPALDVVKTLEAKKKDLQAEFQDRITAIQAQINKLTAIEFVEAA